MLSASGSTAAMAQPALVAAVVEQVDQQPVVQAPQITKRGMAPGPDMGLQAP
jgi:hypothetical protein